MNASVRLPSGEDFNLKLDLLHSIVPEQSTFKVLSTKVSFLKCMAVAVLKMFLFHCLSATVIISCFFLSSRCLSADGRLFKLV